MAFLRAIPTELRIEGILEDIIAVISGAIDGYLIDTNVLALLLKNVAVVGIDKLGIMKLPEKLVGSSEGMLGLILYALVKGLSR
jgi:hypothetical protein